MSQPSCPTPIFQALRAPSKTLHHCNTILAVLESRPLTIFCKLFTVQNFITWNLWHTASSFCKFTVCTGDTLKHIYSTWSMISPGVEVSTKTKGTLRNIVLLQTLLYWAFVVNTWSWHTVRCDSFPFEKLFFDSLAPHLSLHLPFWQHFSTPRPPPVDTLVLHVAKQLRVKERSMHSHNYNCQSSLQKTPHILQVQWVVLKV